MIRAALLVAAAAACLALLPGCGDKEEPALSDDPSPSAEERLRRRLSGTIRVDGPAILEPLTVAAARNFQVETRVAVDVERSGTATAFDKLCTGRVAIAGARRRMRPSERAVCRRRGVDFERLKIANHVVAVATSPELAIRCITMSQLRELWEPGSAVTRYDQLDGDFPSEAVELHGPEIGRADHALFTRLVNGEAGAMRAGWQSTASRRAFSARLAESTRALGFYNLAQLRPVHDARLLAVSRGEGCVEPTRTAVQSGRYPLQEPLYLYVSEQALDELRVRSFMRFFVENYEQLTLEAPATLPVSEQEIADAKRRLPEAPIPGG